MEREIRDFTELTCTNMMLKLKILTKKMNLDEKLDFYASREQYDNIKKPFSKHGLNLTAEKIGNNRYICQIVKIK